MSERQGFLDNISNAFVPVHREGHKFVAIGGAASLLLLWLWPTLGWLCVFMTIFVAYFFRDPDRVTPLREGLIIAPADGVVTHVEKVGAPKELLMGEEERVRVSIHLSLFDVHVNRAPVSGEITKLVYTPGVFVNVTTDKASEDNERSAMTIKTYNDGEVGVVQIAGFIARRIVSFKEEGERIGAGERFGLIRFGSRVDVYLPPGHQAQIAVGQRTVSGETILADLKSDEGEREARRS